MLRTSEDLRPVEGRLEGSFESVDNWSSMTVAPTVRQLRMYLGDPESGPLVWLFNGPPLEVPEGQPKPESHPAITHLHRSPSFRAALGDQPRQFQFDGVWVGADEYLLVDANKVYYDPAGVDGVKTLLVFDDRRGMHPAGKDTATLSNEELIAWNVKRFGPFGEGLPRIHTRNDQAVPGIAITTTQGLQHGGRAKGSLADPSDWSALADGSRIAAAFMGDPVSGSMVIMSRNAPHAVESPAGRCGTDMFRLITKGSCTIGGRPYQAGAFLASEAGTDLGEVVHGPDGSTQLLVATDRRHWAPLDLSGARVTSARLDEISTVLAPFIASPAHVH